MASVTHLGFSDESHWNAGRFRSLGLITFSVEYLNEINGELQRMLQESNVREFRWKNVDGAKDRFVAEKMCAFAVDRACAKQIRADVLIWDIRDSRHNIRGRDDIGNLQRMYYHLFLYVLRTRWPDNAIWHLYPDEHTALDWENVKDCLENVSGRVQVERTLFSGGKFRIRLRKEFGINGISAGKSHEHPPLQLADLFAGMAVFSREKHDVYQRWLESISGQYKLFADSCEPQGLSCGLREKLQVLRSFDIIRKKRKLGISLKSREGLWTPKPENPINFWPYEPQHPEDKAPIKNRFD